MGYLKPQGILDPNKKTISNSKRNGIGVSTQGPHPGLQIAQSRSCLSALGPRAGSDSMFGLLSEILLAVKVPRIRKYFYLFPASQGRFLPPVSLKESLCLFFQTVLWLNRLGPLAPCSLEWLYSLAPSYANRTYSYRIRPTLLSPDAVSTALRLHISPHQRNLAVSLSLSRWLYHVLYLILFLIASGSSFSVFTVYDLAKPNGGAFSPRLKDAFFWLSAA